MVFEDNDTSAYSGKVRPQFAAMRRGIASGEFAAVVAYNIDRLFRQPRDLEAFVDLCVAALVPVITAEGDLDLSSHDGQLHARILAAVAKKESDDKSRRVKRAALDRAEAGRWHGGRVPFGLARDSDGFRLTADACLLRRAARDVIEGLSLTALARRHMDTPGAPRSRQAWRLLLLSPTIAGRTSTGAQGEWPAIVDDQTAANLHAVLTDQARMLHRGSHERQHWLSGLLVCDMCGGLLGHQTTGFRRYRCRRCRSLSISAQAIEQYVQGALFAAVQHVEHGPVQPPNDATPDHQAIQERLDDLAVEYASGQISKSEWKSARAAMMDTHNQRPNSVTPTPVATSSITQDWERWSPTERWRAATFLLRSITILSARPGFRGPLTERVRFDWRR